MYILMRYTHTHNVCVFMCMVGESHGLVCILLYVFLHVKATVLFSNALVPTYVCAMDHVYTLYILRSWHWTMFRLMSYVESLVSPQSLSFDIVGCV